MRKFTFFIVLLLSSFTVFGTTIYDIQYNTTIPGASHTYPSPLAGTQVSTEGIVSGIGFTGGKYVITEGSGAWKGIFVNDPAHTPALGDKVSLTGTVTETGGFTELSQITSYSVINSGNEIPAATPVNPADLQGYPNYPGEAYEGVLVKVTNVKVTLVQDNDIFYVALVSQATPTCQIKDGFFPSDHTWSGVVLNQIWTEITGIVYYSSPNPPQYRINPRNDADMIPQADINTVSLTINNVVARKGETAEVNVMVSRLMESWNLKKYSFTVGFNKRILRFADADNNGTISPFAPELSLSDNEDAVTVTYEGQQPLVSDTNNGVLIKLLFKTLSYGSSPLDLTAGTLNDSIQINLLTDGSITVPITKRIAWLSIYNNDYNKKNIFNPWLNQKITIEYGCYQQQGQTGSKAILRIYDVQGRLVATPINKIISASNGIEYYIWDGRDKNKNLLPIGMYYCHLEIINRTTGNSDTAVQPIVVAAELK
ncbi:MAG: hypothetical protein ACE14O_05750 [Candidatus Cloacimonadaceae bacterium]